MTRVAILVAVFVLACNTTAPPCRLHIAVAGESFGCRRGLAEVQTLDNTTLCCPLAKGER